MFLFYFYRMSINFVMLSQMLCFCLHALCSNTCSKKRFLQNTDCSTPTCKAHYRQSAPTRASPLLCPPTCPRCYHLAGYATRHYNTGCMGTKATRVGLITGLIIFSSAAATHFDGPHMVALHGSLINLMGHTPVVACSLSNG